MILTHLPETTLQSMIKNYDVLLETDCCNRDNIIRFRDDCIQELRRKYDLHTTKQV